MKIPFIKIEGAGNDYIFVDEKIFASRKTDFQQLARDISHRRFGVGSDGLILMKRLGPVSAFMSIYNADGSRAEFCGNGLRGTALYMKSVYKAKGNRFNVSTGWGEYRIVLTRLSATSGMVEAYLGSPSFDPKEIGYSGRNSMAIKVKPAEVSRELYCVAIANPHAVVFVEDFDFDWQGEGKLIEKNRIFRNGINVMFAKVDSPRKLTVMPWERGSGATMACGSGAAAATVISNLLELTRGPVTVRMPGGTLKTRWDIENREVYQQGPARIAFSGIYSS